MSYGQYGLNHEPRTKKNPQTNLIMERIHQVATNMSWSYDLDNQGLDAIDPFGEYLANIVWAARCTYNTTLGVTPSGYLPHLSAPTNSTRPI
eukprot:12325174-Ditylum_brightwellii.AAC.1